MPKTEFLSVKDIKLDLHNYRTVKQGSELKAIHAMIAISPDRFWALAESLLEDGFMPSENVLILKGGKGESTAREGNRRVAIIKMTLGLVATTGVDIPEHIAVGMKAASADWKKENAKLPCLVFTPAEEPLLDKLIARIHGKGEKAGRDKWTAVATARHNRDKNGASEPALDLLEKFLKVGKNLTASQAERWAGDYPLTVLAEAMKKIAVRLGFASAKDMADKYPKVKCQSVLDEILLDVGLEQITFPKMRGAGDTFGIEYGVPAPTSGSTTSTSTGGTGGGTSAGGPPTGKSSTTASTKSAAAKKPKATATDDEKSVKRAVRAFTPRGKNREKVVTLQNELLNLKLEKNPHAFCFVLRSMFELSAKAYCTDHKADGLSTTKPDGSDKYLVNVLREITNHLTKNGTDKAMGKLLHGAMAELGAANGFLSVTSMNQLVHNPKFTVTERHICTLFGNIFPLLQAMNNDL